VVGDEAGHFDELQVRDRNADSRAYYFKDRRLGPEPTCRVEVARHFEDKAVAHIDGNTVPAS
jgi:hypothetical protein